MTEIIEWIKVGIGIEIGRAAVCLFIAVPLMIILCLISEEKEKQDDRGKYNN